MVPHKGGYYEAMCDQPSDARDKQLRRGGDYCQHWHKYIPSMPLMLDDLGAAAERPRMGKT
jgi:hypothetical protein